MDTTPDWGNVDPAKDTVDTRAEDTFVPTGVDTITSGEVTIEIVIPGNVLSGWAEIGAKVGAESPVIGVEFYVDQVRMDTDIIPPYNVAVNTAQFGDGSHLLTVYTADEVGGFASAAVSVVFDNTPPAFKSTFPAEGVPLFFEDGPLHMALEVEDVGPLKAVEFRVNGLLVADFPAPPYEGDIPWDSIYVDVQTLPKNLYLQFHAVDFLGLATEVAYNVVVHRRQDWVYSTLGEIWATAALLPDGNLVFGNLDSKVLCLTPAGGLAWQVALGGGVTVAPAVDPATGRIFVGSLDGKVYALNNGGGQVWTQEFSSPAGGALSVSGGIVILGTYDGMLRGLSASSGGESWSVQLPGYISSSPTVAPDGTVYIGTQAKSLHAVKSGQLQWSFPTGGEIWSTPAVGPDGSVYIGSNDGWLYGVNPGGGQKWVNELKGQIWGRPLVGPDGGIYVGSTSKYLSKLDAVDGTLLWTTKLEGLSYSSPVADADGVVYIGSTSGEIFAVEPVAGAILWRYKAGDAIHATPVLTGGRAIFGSTDRNVYSIRIVPPEG